jgi:hypothetical protein
MKQLIIELRRHRRVVLEYVDTAGIKKATDTIKSTPTDGQVFLTDSTGRTATFPKVDFEHLRSELKP